MAKNDDIVYEEEGNHEKSADPVANRKTSKKVTDDVVSEEEVEAPEAMIKKLKEKLKTAEKEKQEYMNGWQRERADFANYKKRSENEKIEVIKYSNENLVSELISVLDSFEMAFANKEAWEKVDKNWRTGIEYIHSQFIKILKDYGFTEMNPVGEKFDPKFHTAVEHTVINDESKDGVILSVKKKGYILNDRVIVSPQVEVGEHNK